ncbi:WUSCHEL-related homeobox 12-like isoform X1 [Miscanthus floridulus]|uniref:WUSCHEL-related homeobox 12-like isoform X1 n=1 Tax=Miscanthus floridulus TaxID=154761 RepID=UPI003457A696
MASSNRHWPSMYRSSLACNFQQPQPDMNNGGKSSLMSSRCEENGGRNPEPRPRWNPRPEQIRILEGIFNSGMVNPSRDEIRRIRLQLQEYGPVGDANVFYWFQNRKSRTKHKLRAAGQLQPSARATLALANALAPVPAPVTPPRHHLQLAAAAPVAPTSSSSSSSDRSSGSSSKPVTPTTAVALASPVVVQGVMPATAMDLLTPLPPSAAALAARQLYYQYHSQIMAPAAPPMPDLMVASPEPLLPPWQQGGQHYLPATELGGVLGGHTYTHEPSAMHRAAVSLSPSVLFGLCNEALGQDCADISIVSKGLGHGQFWNSTCGSDLSNSKTDAVSAVIRDDEKARLGLLHYHGFGATTNAAAAVASAPLAAAAADAGTAAMLLPSSAPSNAAAATSAAVLTDQLQAGLLDAGLLIGETPPPPPPPTATVVAVARDAVTCAATATAQFSVPAMRLDVKLAFGEAAVLARHTGEAVPVDESGVTVEPLQQDTLYYVLMATNN